MTPAATVTAPILVPVPAIPGVDGDRGSSSALCVDVCASGAASAALTSGGAVFTWGSGGVAGPSPSPSPAPVRELLLRGRIRSIAVGRSFALALTAVGGEVWSWGEDIAGAGVLGGGWGDAGVIGVRAPARVDGFPSPHARITAIAAGAAHALALSATGRIFSWGSNADGALGLGALGPPSESALRRAGVFSGAPPARDRADAVPIPSLVWSLENHSVVSIAAGARASAAITDTGSVFVWGATTAAASCVNTSALVAVAAGARALVPAKLATQLLNPGPGVRGGPPEACYVPSPTLVDGASTTLPARSPRKLLFPHSPAASALILLYNTAHLKESGLRAAAASLAAIGGPSTAGGGGGAPPGAVVDGLLFHDPRELQRTRPAHARSPSRTAAATPVGVLSGSGSSFLRAGMGAAAVLRNRASGASLLSAVLSSLGAPVFVAPDATLAAVSGQTLDLVTESRALLLAHPSATAALATLPTPRLRKLSALARAALAAQLGAIAHRVTAEEAAERTSLRAASRASARDAAYGKYASPIAAAAARSADAYASPFTGPASPAPLPPPAPSLAALLNSPRFGRGSGGGGSPNASGGGSVWGERVAPSSSKNAAVILDLLGARADAALSPLDVDDETDEAIARRAGRLAETLQARMLQNAATNALALFSPTSRSANAGTRPLNAEQFSGRLLDLLRESE